MILLTNFLNFPQIDNPITRARYNPGIISKKLRLQDGIAMLVESAERFLVLRVPNLARFVFTARHDPIRRLIGPIQAVYLAFMPPEHRHRVHVILRFRLQKPQVPDDDLPVRARRGEERAALRKAHDPDFVFVHFEAGYLLCGDFDFLAEVVGEEGIVAGVLVVVFTVCDLVAEGLAEEVFETLWLQHRICGHKVLDLFY